MSLKDPTLRRFWVEHEQSLFRGYGVTAIDVADAVALIERLPDGVRPTTAISRIVEDVDVQTLDTGHVLPNMGAPIWRGVWYPRIGT